jgi:cytochrome P450 / NADPH-cytochrome P450 reductase
MSRFAPIPVPKGVPVFGNLFQIPKSGIVQHFTQLAEQFDGIFAVSFAGYRVTLVSDPQLVAELTDAKRFRKLVGPPLSTLRALAGDGLFTAHSEEPNWEKAHRILMPAFGQRAMRSYFDTMLEVADQLVEHWQTKAGQDIDVSDNMTRLTLDTIALCGFGYRFKSFEQPQLHPFIGAMTGVLNETMHRLTRVRIPNPMWAVSSWQFNQRIRMMSDIVDEVIRERRRNPIVAKDLMGLMLDAVDPDSGQALSDENIRYQVITFLIAGQETTSGFLSFAIYELLANPSLLNKAIQEIDRLLPKGARPTYEVLADMQVLDRVLKETLRLYPTAPLYSVAPYEDTVLGGRYKIKRNHRVNVLLPALHRNPKCWQQADAFIADRFLPLSETEQTAHSYKPFGNGERACIGRQFAIAEAKLALAIILQQFSIRHSKPYQLCIKESLSMKPTGFMIRVTPR